MTNDEAIAIIRNEYKCVDRDCDIEKSCGKCDLMMPSKEPILEAYKLAIKALEQHTCEDEYIKVPKKALKYRTAGMVAYNAEWLKKHWQMELKVMGIECDDAISCEAVIEWLKAKDIIKLSSQEETARKELKALPPVTPQQKYEKWIDYREDGFVECPFCGHATNCEDDIDELHYCFYCGAKMESEVNNG